MDIFDNFFGSKTKGFPKDREIEKFGIIDDEEKEKREKNKVKYERRRKK